MGSLLLQAGEAGVARLAAQLPDHGAPALRRLPGTGHDILIHAKEVEGLKRRLNQIYEKHTGRTYEEIEQALERDRFLSPDRGESIRPYRQRVRKARRAGSSLRPDSMTTV